MLDAAAQDSQDGTAGDGGAGLTTALAGIAAGVPHLREPAIDRVEAGVDFGVLTALSALAHLEIAATRRATPRHAAPARRATRRHVLATLPALRGGPLKSLHIAGRISDLDLSAVAALSQLLCLRIDAAGGVDDQAISDAGFAALRGGLPKLRKLWVDLPLQENVTRVTNASLAAIGALPALRRLTLSLGALPAVTAAGIERMRQLPALVRLQRGGMDYSRIAVDRLFLPWAPSPPL
jgi:hypothetical protein